MIRINLEGIGAHCVTVAADVRELVGADVEDKVHVCVRELLWGLGVIVHAEDELEAL